MRSRRPSRHLFWQTALAVALGVFTGVIILGVVYKRPAQALTHPLALVQNSHVQPAVHILPTLEERMNVLVMGVDSNGRNTERFTGTRSDTMILVSLDPIARKVGVVSIPRDSRVKIAGNHGTDKINAAHAFGGPELAVQTVSENFGVPIDHWVAVDTQALKDLCKLLGPVEVLVEKEMDYDDWSAGLHCHLKPGLQVLNPEQVEQYVRFRHDAKGDIGRIERQQWFFRQAANKLKDPQFLMHLPELIKLAHDSVHTDLSIEDMARLATFAKDMKPENLITATVPGEPQMIAGGSYWVPDLEASRAVFDRIQGLHNGGNFVGAVAVSEAADPDEALAAASRVSEVCAKPLSIALKYPKTCAHTADLLEKELTARGYNVRYKWIFPAVECQHDEIVQHSVRADDYATDTLRKRVAGMETWPVTLSLVNRPIVDFTIVLSPEADLSLDSAETVPVHSSAMLSN